jgi:hypothetical protein
MAEYIDRKPLLKFFEKTVPACDWLVSQYSAEWIYNFIESPLAVDVVKVVRCKDCVYRMELHPMYAYEGRSCKVCFIRNKPVSDNGYCSDAIRREGEK